MLARHAVVAPRPPHARQRGHHAGDQTRRVGVALPPGNRTQGGAGARPGCARRDGRRYSSSVTVVSVARAASNNSRCRDPTPWRASGSLPKPQTIAAHRGLCGAGGATPRPLGGARSAGSAGYHTGV
eukprot:scaffold1535_cov382-Prasinococcus_capsulatus_cf.AAC.11